VYVCIEEQYPPDITNGVVTGQRLRVDLFVSPFDKSEIGIDKDIQETLLDDIGQ
jgi:hypothetical protein